MHMVYYTLQAIATPLSSQVFQVGQVFWGAVGFKFCVSFPFEDKFILLGSWSFVFLEVFPMQPLLL